MSVNDAYTDVVELCALLQCLGFSVKSLDNTDTNLSQDGGTRTVVINCQSSGLHVVLESPGLSCSCPATNQNSGVWQVSGVSGGKQLDKSSGLHVVLESPGLSCSCPATNQNSGVWQVSGVSGGKQLDKEFGCSLLGSLPKAHRERLTSELREMIRCIKQHNESVDPEGVKAREGNKSASMIELSTPEKRLFEPKVDTPTRYRSLDTLTAAKAVVEQPLPAPGPLTKRIVADAYSEDEANIKKLQTMCRRQSTYTLSSTPGSARRRNKTSSPIQNQQNTLLENLIEAEKVAENLRNKLSFVIRNYVEEERADSSMSSLALDVSKISVVKEPAKSQFASSPNLSGLNEDFAKSRLKRFESSSTSNLVKKQTPNEKTSRLRRLSPNIFKTKKDGVKPDKPKIPEAKGSKLNSLFRPKIATPVTRPIESSPNLSASKKKFTHVKSTIPRPTPVKKE